jgi:type IV secretory pathway TrbF-like protein
MSTSMENVTTALKSLIFKRRTQGEERAGEGVMPDGRRAGEGANPYLSARRTWNDHVGDQVASRRAWQMLGVLCLSIALVAVGGMIYIGSQSKFVPYVVEVDKLGQTIAVSPVSPAKGVDQRVIHAAMANFIQSARMVTPDVALQRKAILGAYAMLFASDPATAKMNEFLNGRPEANPFKRAEKETVSTEIVSVIEQTPQTWQVDWTETVRDRQGFVKVPPYRMRALVSMYVTEPAADISEEQIRNNPLGIYVSDFAWSKQI